MTRLFLAVAMFAALAGAASAKDVAGGKDHPLISRYEGAALNTYTVEEYAELDIVRAETPAAGSAHKYGQPAGCKLTAISYIAPAKRTPLEIFRNYEQALRSGGFNVLYSCEPAACAQRKLLGQSGFAAEAMGKRMSGAWSTTVITPEWTENPSHFLSAQLKRATGDVYVALWVMPGYGGGTQAGIYQVVLEAKPADTGMVKVDAAALGKGIAADGKIALYGIFFDTGKAELKSESAAQIDEMAKLLKSNAALKVFIVGHTDNQGAFDANLASSQKRAEAVVGALVKDHKIDAKRLAARGAANISPVASNGSEAGRAKNRRVELVEQ